ncbi:hypothetical protein JNUCC0626_22430 [Lentzea sp. JNUCC 0626]|uniref:hypothetical protein n=1 Tax=Lentzea sp. JNUCC 0626 TaxID=3367513 RepID=UPI00374A6398
MERKLTALLALVLLTGCAAPPQQVPELVDQQRYARDLQDGSARFSWPDSRKPDLGVLAEKSGPGPDRAPAGSERIVLEITNSCAWYLDWEDARKRGDQAAATKALQVMGEVLPKFSPEDPDGQRYARETAAKAERGDGSLAADYVTNNCDSVLWK